MGDTPFATAVLQSMLVAAASDLARLTDCKAPSPGMHALSLQQMLKALRGSLRTRNATVDQTTYVAIEPESVDQGVQTDKDIAGFDGHVRALSGQHTLAVREQREALAAQHKEHRTYSHALKSVLQNVEEVRSHNVALAANAECVWRLAQSRGVLGDAEGALYTAWSGSLQLPQGFGYAVELDSQKVVA